MRKCLAEIHWFSGLHLCDDTHVADSIAAGGNCVKIRAESSRVAERSSLNQQEVKGGKNKNKITQ